MCVLTGDRRQNEQTVLTAMHTVFMRYHNYIAHNLQRQHPQYTDEQLYQVHTYLYVPAALIDKL